MPTPLQDPLQEFGIALRDLRIGAGISQETLASQAGVDRTYVSSCERGKRNVSLLTIVKFALALQVDPAVLLARRERRTGGG